MKYKWNYTCTPARVLTGMVSNRGKIADDALSHLCNLLKFDVVQVESTEAQYDLFNESDDEEGIQVSFGNLEVERNQTQRPSAGLYDVNENSIENEIQKFLKQPNSHFVECKFLSS